MKMVKAIVILFLFLSITACGNHKSETVVKTDDEATESKQKNQNENSTEKIIAKMSLDEKIGQMIFAGIDGTTMNANTKTLIDRYKVGGVILYKPNIQSTNQTLALLNGLKKENSDNKMPLFLGVDQEGGRVQRLPDDWKKIPSSGEIGKVNRPEFSYEIGTLLGKELKAIGFNLDFAPVLDINSNPNNPVIGDRSFGSDSKKVSHLGIETMKGIKGQNVIPVVKHFPGHGDTSVDSHIGLPKVTKNLDQLRKFELVPFKQSITKGADVVMVAHILLPKIDSSNPATFSKRMITDVLRKEMKFKGVVMTDDMTMGAITKHYSIGDAAVKSVNSGSDVILIGHDYNQVITVIKAIKSAVQKGTVPESKINSSVYKIISLKQKYKLTNSPVQSVDVKGINRSIQETLHRYMD
ncbi:beta-N-acetylhexosaminidase [Fictibacillus gelatini]|uniref:beta-N-acetylhexosaminidase n=1 Tax=Fictibacillus gelatini TaxID=225985 RepID=UPI00041B2D40|nr:beta-N-acetylhexosaminidase [Fictibacillus gelatini]